MVSLPSKEACPPSTSISVPNYNRNEIEGLRKLKQDPVIFDQSSVSIDVQPFNQSSVSIDVQPFDQSSVSIDVPPITTSILNLESKLNQCPSQNTEDVADPATYANKKLTPQQINFALKIENQKLDDMTCPVKKGRKFLPSWRICNLSDGTKKERKWLVYSKTKDAAFCLHCTIFSLQRNQTVWSTTGYSGWTEKHAFRDIELHESSKIHLESQVARIRWLAENRVDSNLLKQNSEQVKHHREVMSVIIDCCKFLSEEMLAFRKKNCMTGKLIKLFRLLAKHNPDARVYLEKIDSARQKGKKLGSNLLSYNNVFDLIDIMSKLVVAKIVDGISSSGVYSIIVDSTYDASKREATAVLVRYVQQINDDEQLVAKPTEHLLKVFTSGDTSGESLSQHVMDTLKSLKISQKGMIGQSMDGAENMSGRYKGMKTFIQKECPTAMYVWCYSHRLALVIEKSIDICPVIKNMFSLMEELYVFMSGHWRNHKLVENLEKSEVKNIRQRRLKRVQTTRWSSKNDSLKSVLSCYDIIRQTLEEISIDKKSDTDTTVSCKGLLNQLTNFEVVAAMNIAFKIFKIVNPVTICLQGKSVDYGIAHSVITEVKENIKSLRSDDSWEQLHSEILEFAAKHELPAPIIKRTRRKKRFMDELAVDEVITDPIKKMKVDVYFRILDSLITQLEDRFSKQSLSIMEQMVHFSHAGLQKMMKSILPKQIQELCDFYNLDSEEIATELESFSFVYKATHMNIDISDILPKGKQPTTDKKNQNHKNQNEYELELESEHEDADEPDSEKEEENTGNINEMLWLERGFIRPYRCLQQLSGFRNLNFLYKILLSLSVTSCSAERTMSRLKLVKNRLRTSMGDTWLNNLLILCSEQEVLDKIQHEEIIDMFAISTKQRSKLLLRS